jgi:hypothetical protein
VQPSQIVSPSATQIKTRKKTDKPIVSTLMTQLQTTYKKHDIFVTTVLTQIQWSSHLHILNKTASPEEKLFYLTHTIKDKLSVRKLERQINSTIFERSLMTNQIVSSLPTQFPTGVFKDPYIFEFLDLPDGHSENAFLFSKEQIE